MHGYTIYLPKCGITNNSLWSGLEKFRNVCKAFSLLTFVFAALTTRISGQKCDFLLVTYVDYAIGKCQLQTVMWSFDFAFFMSFLLTISSDYGVFAPNFFSSLNANLDGLTGSLSKTTLSARWFVMWLMSIQECNRVAWLTEVNWSLLRRRIVKRVGVFFGQSTQLFCALLSFQVFRQLIEFASMTLLFGCTRSELACKQSEYFHHPKHLDKRM